MTQLTDAEMKARFAEAQRFTEKLGKWIVSQQPQTDIAAMALMNLAVDAVRQQFGDEAADEFGEMIYGFIVRRTQSQADNQFWNLMAEKGYDKPAKF